MSKSVDEIAEDFVWNSVLKGIDPSQCAFNGMHGYDLARLHLKKALSDKVLVRPMSEEKIMILLNDHQAYLTDAETYVSLKDKPTLAKLFYQAQFEEKV